jgi:hypothetical protein
MKMKLLLCASCFFIGYFAANINTQGDQDFTPQNPQKGTSNSIKLNQKIESLEKQIEHLKAKTQSIADNDLTKYLNTQDADQKLKQANEIFSKIMLLFLADLGLHLNNQVKELTEKPPKLNEEKKFDKDLIPAKASSKVVRDEEEKEAPELSNFEGHDFEKPPLYRQAKKFILTEPRKKFYESKYDNKMDRKFQRIQGTFTGRLTFFEGKNKGRTDEVKLEIDFKRKGNRKKIGVAGTSLVELSKHGEPYSVNRGRGDNRVVKSNSNDPKSIYIEVEQNAFFQVQWKNNGNTLYGNYYVDDKYIGHVNLRKIDRN